MHVEAEEWTHAPPQKKKEAHSAHARKSEKKNQ